MAEQSNVNFATSRIQRSLHILFVDDEPIIALSSVDALEEMGHIVEVAYSGADALAILNSAKPFDLLITDFSMPRMNGAELVIEARQLFPDLMVLITTGYTEQPDGSKFEWPYLAKPYTQDQLVIAIERAMDGKID